MGQYRLLIRDGHGSHSTVEFDQYCKERSIIPLYMPPYSSHKLQPLDVTCFAPLKTLYSRQIKDAADQDIYHIQKEDFLYHFKKVYSKAFNTANIKQGFAATGLSLYNPQRVLQYLKDSNQTSLPPSTSSSNQYIYLGKTPLTLYQLDHQKAEIETLQEAGLSSLITDQALEKIYKDTEMAMQNAVLLQQELKTPLQ